MRTICRSLLLVIILSSVFVFAKSEDTAREKARGLMVNAYGLVHDADVMLAKGEDLKSTEDLYFNALKHYMAIEKVDADWLTAVIHYRIAYCNGKVIELRKKRGVVSKMEPKEEIANDLQGRMTIEKIEELLNIRNTELKEVRNELDATTRKLEQEMLSHTLDKEKFAEMDKKMQEKLAEMDKKWQENASEGYISVSELNKIVAPLRKKIEELKEAYKNAKTDEERAKVIEQYVIFVQTLNKQLKFEDLHLAGMNIETIIIDVRDQNKPVIYKNGEVKNDPLVPTVVPGKK